MALNQISVRNLRSLHNKQTFNLAPLSFAVGANSSGKSTFLRIFPLLRQSTETTTKGPILWYGKYVDLGIFDSVVSRGSKEKEIEFEFQMDLVKTEEERYLSGPSLHILEPSTIGVGLTISSIRGLTYTKKITLQVFGVSIDIHAEPEGSVVSITLNHEPVNLGTVTKVELTAGDSLFSMVVRRKRQIKIQEGFVPIWMIDHKEGLIPSQILSSVKELFRSPPESDKSRYVAARIGLGNIHSFFEQLKNLAAADESISNASNEIREDGVKIDRLRELVIIDRLPLLLGEISQMLSSTFSGVRYMGPVRAVAQRFYRQQDLAVNEVDQTGENLPMFLMGLTQQKREQFSSWCAEKFGFRLSPRTDGAHVSVFVSDTLDGEMYNIADMGFGYSQILPLLATIWLETQESSSVQKFRNASRSRRGAIPRGGPTIVIEQPELHLHPRMQARLADLLIGIAKLSYDKGFPVRVICETHSEIIINRVGYRIAEDDLPPEIARVFLFEKFADSEHTEVREAEFDSYGVLHNWPFGFFLPELD